MLAISGFHVGLDTGSYERSCTVLYSHPLGIVDAYPGLTYLGFLVPFCGFLALPGATLHAWCVVQSFLSAAGVGLLFLAAYRLAGPRVAWVAGLVLALLWETFRWDGYALSDSLFVFILDLALWRMSLQWTGKGSRGWLLAALAWLALARPVGILVVGAWLACDAVLPRTVFPSLLGGRRRAAGCLVGLALLVPILGRTLADTGALDSWKNGVLVWDDPLFRYPYTLAPADSMLSFVLHNPLDFLAMAALKAALLFLPVVPRFSVAHNVLNAVTLIPLTLMAGVGGFGAIRRRSPVAGLCLPALGALLAGVAANSVDFDWRYRAPAGPLLAILAAVAASPWLERPGMARGGGAF